MCGRFVLQADYDGLQLGFPGFVFPDDIQDRFNIAPTQPVLATKNDGSRRMDFLRWGLIPSWSKDPKIGNRMINARAETASEKPSFRSAYKRHRCIIPASGYYEWVLQKDGKKHPVYIFMSNQMPMAFAGLWEVWNSPEGDEVHSCAILTTDANKALESLHHRMPVILEQGSFDEWLEVNDKRPGDLDHLLGPYSVDNLDVHQVSTLVNSPANDRAECIESVKEQS